TFARPRSASSSSVLRPACASDTPRLTATLVLPTPPLPLVTAITRSGRRSGMASRPSAWCAGKRASGERMRDSSERSGKLDVIGTLAMTHEIHGTRHQLMRAHQLQILGHALAVGDVAHRQAVPDRHGNRAAEFRGFVE